MKFNENIIGKQIINNAYTCALKYLIFEFQKTQIENDIIISTRFFNELNDIFYSNLELAPFVYNVENDKIYQYKKINLDIRNIERINNDEIKLIDPKKYDENIIQTTMELLDEFHVSIENFIYNFLGEDGIYIFKKFWRSNVYYHLYTNALRSSSYKVKKVSSAILFTSIISIVALRSVCDFRYHVINSLYPDTRYDDLTFDIRYLTFINTVFHEITDNALCISISDKMYNLKLEPQFFRIPIDDNIHISIQNCTISSKMDV